jgi:hypothetical protein
LGTFTRIVIKSIFKKNIKTSFVIFNIKKKKKGYKNIDLRRWKEKRGDAVTLDSRETGRKVKCRGCKIWKV